MTSDTEPEQLVLNQVYDALGVDSLPAAIHKLAAIAAACPVSPSHSTSAPVERCSCDESVQLRAELAAMRVAVEQRAQSFRALKAAFDALAHVLAPGGTPR